MQQYAFGAGGGVYGHQLTTSAPLTTTLGTPHGVRVTDFGPTVTVLAVADVGSGHSDDSQFVAPQIPTAGS